MSDRPKLDDLTAGADERRKELAVPDDLDALRRRASRLPNGTWSCVRDGVTEPCGDCSGCREIQAENAMRKATSDD